MILETIIKHWVVWLCTLVGGLIAAFYKKIRDKFKHNKELRQAEKNDNMKNNIIEAVKPLVQEFADRSDKNDAELQQEISSLVNTVQTLSESVDVVTEGVLNVQGSLFKRKCRELLEQKEPLTQQQYDMCMHDHKVYNKLHGNHDGDQLFALVTAKYEGQLKGSH